VSNLRQFQAGKINFTVKSAKFKIIALKNQPKSAKFKQITLQNQPNLNEISQINYVVFAVVLFCLVCWFTLRLWFFYHLNIHLLLHYI